MELHIIYQKDGRRRRGKMKGEHKDMMIYSIKLSKKKLLAGVAAVVALALLFACCGGGKEEEGDSSQQMVETSAEVTMENDEQRVAFLKQLGYESKAEPMEFCEIIIPQEFDGVYTNYNQLQLECGYDLTKYKGKRVKRYTYEVTNYGVEERVAANLLVLDGKLIGGDISSINMDGFMHGLKPKDT